MTQSLRTTYKLNPTYVLHPSHPWSAAALHCAGWCILKQLDFFHPCVCMSSSTNILVSVHLHIHVQHRVPGWDHTALNLTGPTALKPHFPVKAALKLSGQLWNRPDGFKTGWMTLNLSGQFFKWVGDFKIVLNIHVHMYIHALFWWHVVTNGFFLRHKCTCTCTCSYDIHQGCTQRDGPGYPPSDLLHLPRI